MIGVPIMKFEMFEDDFDQYFARAAELQNEESKDARRGSLPVTQLQEPSPCLHRRVASCKYPRRKSASRDSSKSPRRGSMLNVEKSPEDYRLNGDSYVNEHTLRAPSPGPSVKCHSAPHSRSSSWKKMKRPRSNKDLNASEKSRSGSIPMEETIEKLKILQADDICPVRNFALSSRGIINRGDSFKRKSIHGGGSTSNLTSETAAATVSGAQPPAPPAPQFVLGDESLKASRSRNSSQCSNSEAIAPPPMFKVVLVGDAGVGKSAIVQQFMTSDYMGALDTSFDLENERTISVCIDGKETTMDFLEVDWEENKLHFGEVDAFILVFSLIDKATFQHCLSVLRQIRQDDIDHHAAVIMVANKSELVRSRQVTEEEAKEACMTYDCKYIEISVALNLKLDELLVGVVRQIRLQAKRVQKRRKSSMKERKFSALEDTTCIKSAKGFLGKFLKRPQGVSKSCDNLLVL